VSTAGYVWAYNTQIYYQDIGTDDETIAWYMSWIPLVFGCIGVSLGGFISDRVVKKLGPYGRLAVLVVSQVSSSESVVMSCSCSMKKYVNYKVETTESRCRQRILYRVAHIFGPSCTTVSYYVHKHRKCI